MTLPCGSCGYNVEHHCPLGSRARIELASYLLTSTWDNAPTVPSGVGPLCPVNTDNAGTMPTSLSA